MIKMQIMSKANFNVYNPSNDFITSAFIILIFIFIHLSGSFVSISLLDVIFSSSNNEKLSSVHFQLTCSMSKVIHQCYDYSKILQTVFQIKLNTSNESYPHECFFSHIQVKFMFFNVTTSLHFVKIIQGNKVLANSLRIYDISRRSLRKLSGNCLDEK